MKFKDQAAIYIREIQTRRREPVRAATVRIYQSYLDAHILPQIGYMSTELITNGNMKGFVSYLNSQKLAPSTVNAVFNLVKAVISSEVDENGDEVNPRKWNPDFLDLPIVNKANQSAPIVTPDQIQEALRAAETQDSRLAAMVVLLASSGMRVGEVLALRGYESVGYSYSLVGSSNFPEQVRLKGTYGFSYWDPETGVIHVKSTLTKGKISPEPKTSAGNREIDLAPEVNDYLKRDGLPTTGFLFQNRDKKRVRIETLYDQFEALGLTDGFHAFRRFRATHLESQNVPRSLTRFWLGHSGKDITDRYIQIGRDLQTRRYWALKAGIGFQLGGKS